jgi:hypothetical protein
MPMAARQDKDEFHGFTIPVVTSKAYLTRGPSGWPETFDRVSTDKALASFLGKVTTEEAVETFAALREVAEDKITNWHTVIGYLGRMVGVTPLAVPLEAGVAFWGRYVLAIRERGAN